MAKKKKSRKPLDDGDILVIAETGVRQGVGWMDSKLSTERSRVIQYYNSKLPAQNSTGRSPYVSTDVYDAVESMKAQLLETFAGNPDNLVSFPPQNDDDQAGAAQATEYTAYQAFRLNDGYGIFRDVIHDGLMGRVGITKVFWETKSDTVDETFENLPETDALALANSEEVEEFDAEEVEEGVGLYNGKLTRRIDTSSVCLVSVPSEEFVISRSAKCIETANMVSHRTLKGRNELIDEGYDKDKVNSINWEDARSLDLTTERQEREQAIDDAEEEEGQEELRKVMLYETYMKIDMKDGKGASLYKICHAGNILLDKQEVDRAPFKSFCPLPVPHVFHGNNFALKVIPTQNARTMLTRAILDHTAMTTNPRWGVVKGGLMNPKEMLDNRYGGLVNMTRPDAVKPLEQQALNPFVFQVLEMLKANKEESTGISALSQGLNKDAISNQNSQGLVQDLVTLSQGRQKIIARNFAYNYLVPLFVEIYRLVLENEKAEKIVEICGTFTKINVADWIERKDCKVALHLGYGERDKQAQKLKAVYAGLASDPGIAPMFKAQNRYDLAMDALRADQLPNFAKYLSKPEQIDPPQPDPINMKELEIEDKKAQATLIMAQAQAVNKQKQVEVAANKEMLAELKLHIDTVFREREADRQDADVANRIDVSQREVKVLEEAPPAENATAFASPAG